MAEAKLSLTNWGLSLMPEEVMYVQHYGFSLAQTALLDGRNNSLALLSLPHQATFCKLG